MATAPATAPALVWFRRDLRLADNPALHAAVQSGRPLLFLYIREDDPALRLSPGAAADWWLHHSLKSLAGSLEEIGGRLVLRSGAAAAIIPDIVRETGVREVFWNRVDWPWLDERDRAIAEGLQEKGVKPRAFRATTLLDPARVLNKTGEPYKVFSAFWRAAQKDFEPRAPLPAPGTVQAAGAIGSDTLEDWNLLPEKPDWARGFSQRWTPGEPAARRRLDDFLGDALSDYKTCRDRPDVAGTSRLSPHLAWGEISPRTVWHRVQLQAERGQAYGATEKYLAEIGWRDFAYYLVHHFGDLREKNFDSKFDHFPWRENDKGLKAWQRGQTGVPMVDAAMRELWGTGWMHNRTRMIAASYLIKHIGCHWADGMRWFEDTLVDADPAVNAASWQWVAGSGADAAPYFRIFNPATQGEKFDPEGHYVRRWVSELAELPKRYIHAPWAASGGELAHQGVELGKTYPRPVVDLKAGREAALSAFETMKTAAAEDA
ncbi:MAG: deoxyribodipyrimidine photo-lyase [Pseudomonadota bacterium]|nr:deoxyribodipyrimidine photo-lyase [Pseudomonadota bacterium]